ncbi:hypothetical protein [Methylophaga nitratireducenticrescens]|uniref:Uncharacterized protein n=1 Tax=Methylophaga nitratireducenticrescens TaxID=754476 RepID=I1XKK9_METNJ|nr:hypothetical protein [Methylophaga nitratireducenticrescens]AFI84928.1 hypothetical protein Q7A_2114 [Methylophaga nitratireducenticrescens]AUZ84943.1 hypothetical protein CDW43_10300 [Methylophaga nitratireducenticrescens]
MKKLVLQFVIHQWDKSQLTEHHEQLRQALPDRYPMSNEVLALFNNKVLLDQLGDDVSGNRLRYQLIDNHLLIDRFHFDLDLQTVEFKPRLQADEPPILLAKLNEGWVQCQYQWRYRVDDGGFIYWRYEKIIVNACFIEKVNSTVFLDSPPDQCFKQRVSI